MNVTVVTDASYSTLTRIGSWGAFAESDRGQIGGSGIFRESPSSSNAAEFMAAANGLHMALSSGVAERGDIVVVRCDSLYVVRIMQGANHRRQSDERVAESMLRRLAAEHRVSLRFSKVRGHADLSSKRDRAARARNHEVDAAARRARRALESLL